MGEIVSEREEVASLQRRLLPIEAVMAQLGVGRSVVFELIGTNQLRSVKIGRRRLIPQSAVDDFVANLIATSDSGASDPRGAVV
jgi:excisionase family DNA binding protein